MLSPLRQRLRVIAIRRRHREAALIEAMELPEDLRLAAKSRVMRRFEEALNQFA